MLMKTEPVSAAESLENIEMASTLKKKPPGSVKFPVTVPPELSPLMVTRPYP
jgi:hypothetical protein